MKRVVIEGTEAGWGCGLNKCSVAAPPRKQRRWDPRETVADRENWAGHVCLGRGRVTITFQLIKNKAPAECNRFKLSLAASMRYARVSRRCTTRHFHVSCCCLRTFGGLITAQVRNGTRGGSARDDRQRRVAGAAFGTILSVLCWLPRVESRPLTLALRAPWTERTIRNSEYLRNVTWLHNIL